MKCACAWSQTCTSRRTMTLHPAIPLEIRVHHLEGITYGRKADQALFGSAVSPATKKPVSRQTKELETRLEKVSQSTESLKRFVDSFTQYRPLLGVPSSVTSTTNVAVEDGAVTTRDLLPADAKAALVIEAAADIGAVERSLREIEVLQQRGTDGAGQLEDLLPLRPLLLETIRDTEARKAVLSRDQEEASRLLARHESYTTTSSDLFLNIHNRLEALEAAVSSMERKKRAEAALHY